jgi:hypothetical protein
MLYGTKRSEMKDRETRIVSVCIVIKSRSTFSLNAAISLLRARVTRGITLDVS